MKLKKLNIGLLQSYSFDPDMPSRPEVTEIYGNYLPSFGHRVTWITPSNERGRAVQKKFFNHVEVYVVPYHSSSLLPLKIFNLIAYTLKEYMLLIDIFKKERYDLIQTRNNIFDALLALYIKRKYKVPFVFQYSFPTYHAQYSHKFIRALLKYTLFRYTLHKADLIFPISKWMKEELVNEGILESKMMPLPMGVNPELFSPSKDGKKIREKYNLNGLQVILYIGTMDKLRQLNMIIRAFSKVRTQKDNAKLLMVGEGNDKTNLEELASRCGIREDILFTGQVSYFDVPYFIAAADVCLCPVPPLSIYKVSSPTKLFEYMVMGKSVVANEEIPEQKEVIEESGGGVLVKFEEESFANGIIEILDDPGRAKEIGAKGHEWAVKNRSYENMAREVEKRYFELLDHNRGE